jgi:2-polyprenyl-6-hydroxyphenyl methylase/3-demethylubiquinone-9 3-methyltransferase
MSEHNVLKKEADAFDRQVDERIKHGFTPDLRRLQKVEWFYNNVWREPEFAQIHWMPRIDKIIDQARESGRRVLELGCGNGMLSLECARNGMDVIGVDLSPKSIEIAERFKDENPFKEQFGSLQYICSDITQLVLEEGSFDSVIFFRSLHHIADGNNVIKKAASYLRDKGKIIISEPIRGHFTKESARFATILRTILPTWIDYHTKLNKPWSSKLWQEEIEAIFTEYTMDGEHKQSPLDNSINTSHEIKSLIEKFFTIIEESYSDACVDKIIGGLRGEHRYELARFLRFLDDEIVQTGALPPTSMELVAVKKADIGRV